MPVLLEVDRVAGDGFVLGRSAGAVAASRRYFLSVLINRCRWQTHACGCATGAGSTGEYGGADGAAFSPGRAVNSEVGAGAMLIVIARLVCWLQESVIL